MTWSQFQFLTEMTIFNIYIPSSSMCIGISLQSHIVDHVYVACVAVSIPLRAMKIELNAILATI